MPRSESIITAPCKSSPMTMSLSPTDRSVQADLFLFRLEEEAPLTMGEVRKTWPEHGEIVFNNVEMRYRYVTLACNPHIYPLLGAVKETVDD